MRPPIHATSGANIRHAQARSGSQLARCFGKHGTAARHAPSRPEQHKRPAPLVIVNRHPALTSPLKGEGINTKQNTKRTHACACLRFTGLKGERAGTEPTQSAIRADLDTNRPAALPCRPWRGFQRSDRWATTEIPIPRGWTAHAAQVASMRSRLQACLCTLEKATAGNCTRH